MEPCGTPVGISEDAAIRFKPKLWTVWKKQTNKIDYDGRKL